MNKKQKKKLLRIIITFILFVPMFIAERVGLTDKLNIYITAAIYGVIYVIISYDIVKKAFHSIINAQMFDENLLMCIASIAAFCIGEFEEAVAVALFYQVGDLFESCAVGKSRKSIKDLMDICPEYANIERDGELIEVLPDEVMVGTTIVIKPGERVPIDGVIIEGETLLDTKALTGESVPRRTIAGDEIFSGCLNGNATIKVKTTKAFTDSTVAKILELTEKASSKKAKIENFITRFSAVYTPAVTICALLLALIPPILFGGNWGDWVHRACVFLVVSCPCALVISVPLGFFGGIGAASRLGVLVKGGNFLEALSHTTTMVFDKTGTLTKGEFKVTDISPIILTKSELLELAALGEGYSTHPIAASVKAAYNKPLIMDRISDYKELAGFGVSAVIDGKTVLLGNEKLMLREGVSYTQVSSGGTIIYIAIDSVFAGSVTIDDTLKDGAKESIQNLKQNGVNSCVMLTGDRQKAAEHIKEALNLDSAFSDLLPADKVSIVEELLNKQPAGEKLAFVGDGINDTPVLARADIGIAMGSMGSDSAIEAADIVIMDDDLTKLSKVIAISRKTNGIVKMNVVFALGVKALVLILGAFGVTNMWAAVFADVGVSVIAILNSMRTLK